MRSSKVEGPIVDDMYNPSHTQPPADPAINDTVRPGMVEASQSISHPPVPPRNGINDYLIARRGNNLAEEENPFDSQFGGGPAKSGVNKTPGGSLLPSIKALQSGSAPGFMDGLRQGPLSPNMLAGPKEPTSDYFSGEHGMGLNDGPRVFTPNESALRHQTLPLPPGITSPGGSMFQGSLMPGMQSPGLFGLGVATPGTAEFNRTANEIRERQLATIVHQPKREMNITSQPHQMNEENNNGLVEFVEDNQSNAAASLFMLANSASSRDTSPHHYNLQPRQAQPSAQKQILNRNQQILNQQMSQQMNQGQVNGQMAGRSNNLPVMNGHAHAHAHAIDPRTRNNSIHSELSSPSNSLAYEHEMNGHGGQSSGKKSATAKRKASANKTTPKNNKRSKASGGSAGKRDEFKEEDFTNEDLDHMEEDHDPGDLNENEEHHDKSKSKKPETDDEKRKSFLERNRVAALKCRQRKKQWLNNLQAKVDSYSNENEILQHKVAAMQNEIVQLRTMLVAHKDSPLGQQQGIASLMMGPMYDEQHMHVQNPYGMAGMPPPQNPGM